MTREKPRWQYRFDNYQRAFSLLRQAFELRRDRPLSDIDLVLYGDLEEREVDRIYTLFDESNLGLRVDVQAYQHIQYPPLKRHIDAQAKVLFTRREIMPGGQK